jgi:CxxC motif-containing protein (DUF1111 family)
MKTALVVSVFTLLAVSAQGQQAGDPFSGLTSEQRAAFDDGKEAFEEEEDILEGLGPIFNGTSCAQCHSNPAVGGDSNIVETRFGTTDKKKFDALGDLGGSLIQSQGIGRVAECGERFVGEEVPDEATIVTGRKTTPLFGLGLVDAVPDSTFENLAQNGGKVNRVQDPVSGGRKVGKFGWKAQVSSLLVFAAEAYVNEMGITSPLFPAEQCPNGDCAVIERCNPVPDPEDDGDDGAPFGEDVEKFAAFMTLLAPVLRGPDSASPSVEAGEAVFNRIGCEGCHVSALTTGTSPIAALNQKTFHPYSDFLVHHMGTLGDGIAQGQAAGDEMRTAPLWGLRFRRRFLHDGRARTPSAAIEAHDGAAKAATQAFQQLTAADRQALLDFLGSL